MAAALLAKLGAEALRPHFLNGAWRKAAVSAKAQARLRREALLAGRYNFASCSPACMSAFSVNGQTAADTQAALGSVAHLLYNRHAHVVAAPGSATRSILRGTLQRGGSRRATSTSAKP